jgi:hypothetical protein
MITREDIYTILRSSKASAGFTEDVDNILELINTTYQPLVDKAHKLEAKNTSYQADMEAVLKAASASTNLDVTEQLYRVIQERDGLKLEKDDLMRQLSELRGF